MMKRPSKITFVVAFVFGINSSLQRCTRSDKETFFCENRVPVSLPVYVKRVYINIYALDIGFSAESFFHESWRNVTFLDITADQTDQYEHFKVTFGSMCFSQLNALKYLRLHGDRIKQFSNDAFDEINHLQELQFSECSELKISNVVNILLNVNITIDTLSINDVSASIGETLTFDNLFYELIKRIKVKSLNLRKSIFKVILLSKQHIKPANLEALDISQTIMLIPKDTTSIHALYERYALFLHGLKTLNLSAVPVQIFLPDYDFFNNKIIRNCLALGHHLIRVLFLSVENLYTDAIFQREVIMNNTLLNISDCHVNLKKWHFRRNKLQTLNISIYLPPDNALTEVDFSFNEIKYISPLALRTAKSLKILKLASNELFQMEALPEFNDILSGCIALQYFSIADNTISKLPCDIFRHNVALEVIDLADNNMQAITFTINHLKKLKKLSLVRNRIKYLDSKAVTKIKLFFQSYIATNTTVIVMAGNPLVCSCESIDFMEWTISFVQQHSRRKYECTMENEVTTIDKDALHYSNYLCYRTIIITCAIIAGVVLIFMGFCFTMLILRRRRKQKEKCKRKLFLKEFQKGNLQEQYLCQISYSSEDELCALNIIYARLNTVLNRKCPCRRNIICIGDKTFCLGRPIVDEIIRCISESCVTIFVISKSFCKSQWCELELKEAYATGKPIILIFKEEVKTNIMSKLLLTVFNRITRAKLVEENEGEISLVPDWEILGDSIMKLATEQYVAKQQYV